MKVLLLLQTQWSVTPAKLLKSVFRRKYYLQGPLINPETVLSVGVAVNIT